MNFIEKLTSTDDFGSGAIFYGNFVREISDEHSKRLILRLANVVTKIQFQELASYLAVPNDKLKELLKDLEDNDGLIVEETEECLSFHPPQIEPLLETHLNQIKNLIESMRK